MVDSFKKFRKRTFEVTREHIRKGKCGDERKCAVALAVAEVTPGWLVSVEGDSIKFFPKTKKLIEQFPGPAAVVMLPKKVVTFIDQFDMAGGTFCAYKDLSKLTKAAKEKLKPISFTISAPPIS